jgi:hypothetical protein
MKTTSTLVTPEATNPANGKRKNIRLALVFGIVAGILAYIAAVDISHLPFDVNTYETRTFAFPIYWFIFYIWPRTPWPRIYLALWGPALLPAFWFALAFGIRLHIKRNLYAFLILCNIYVIFLVLGDYF